MKKSVFLLVFVALFLGEPFAQDTVHIRDFRTIEKYFVPVWPDAFPKRTYGDSIYVIGYISNMAENFSQAKEEAYKMYSKDTLLVYGIAASLSTMWRLYPDSYVEQIQEGTLDTSCEFLYDYLRLYEADPDSLRHIGDELLVNLRYTPVSYYVDLDLWNPSLFERRPVIPMYERYFSTPVTVADSFYVGRRFRPDHHDGRDVILPMLSDTLTYGIQYLAWNYDYIEDWGEYYGIVDTIQGWGYGWLLYQLHPFLFPIIAPPDTTVNPNDTTVTPIDTVVNPGDTIVVFPGDTLVIGGDTIVNTGDTVIVTPGEPVIIGGDTLVVNPDDSIIVIPGGNTGVGLRPNDLIYRYTNIAPNPARNSVRITSSFGLSRIEAYDLRGRLIYESPQLSTFSFPLSTIEWPRGTYLLRITTPAGTTTKKLLIQ
jgi:hypothetical protein